MAQNSTATPPSRGEVAVAWAAIRRFGPQSNNHRCTIEARSGRVGSNSASPLSTMEKDDPASPGKNDSVSNPDEKSSKRNTPKRAKSGGGSVRESLRKSLSKLVRSSKKRNSSPSDQSEDTADLGSEPSSSSGSTTTTAGRADVFLLDLLPREVIDNVLSFLNAIDLVRYHV